MNVEIMAMCNGAWVHPELGLLSCRQSFDAITVPQFPYTHSSLMIALRIRFHASEQGAKRVKLVMGRPDNVPLDLCLTMFRFKVPKDSTTGVHQSVTRVTDLELPVAGVYELRLNVDYEERSTVPLLVRLKR